MVAQQCSIVSKETMSWSISLSPNWPVLMSSSNRFNKHKETKETYPKVSFHHMAKKNCYKDKGTSVMMRNIFFKQSGTQLDTITKIFCFDKQHPSAIMSCSKSPIIAPTIVMSK